jgi:predicted nucleic acid-binding Zn ribbon protein
MATVKLHLNEQRDLGIPVESIITAPTVRFECSECGRLLAKVDDGRCTIEIKCPKCKTLCRRQAL